MMEENILITDFPISSITNHKLQLTKLLLMISVAFSIGRNNLKHPVGVLTEHKRGFSTQCQASRQILCVCSGIGLLKNVYEG